MKKRQLSPSVARMVEEFQKNMNNLQQHLPLETLKNHLFPNVQKISPMQELLHQKRLT